MRKLLLAVLLVSLAGSAFGAGTFASFNASTTNAASTFQTGSMVLTNNNGTNTCYSTGTNNNAAGASTDTNANTACDNVFTAGTSKPGDTASQALTLKNDGTLAASGGLKVYRAANPNCTDGQSTTSNSYYGTGSLCDTLQMTMLDTTGNLCLFGGGAAGETKGTAAALASQTSTVTITSSSNDTLTVNGTSVTIAAGTYGFTLGSVSGSNTSLASAIQTALNTGSVAAIVGVGMDGVVYLASSTPGGAIPTVTAGTARATLGLTTVSTVYSATQAATCTADPAYTVGSFGRVYTSSSGLTVVSSLAAAATRVVTVGLKIDSSAGNSFQGRKVTFGLTWFES